MERVEKLGFIGDVVDVKSGFARNFLLPKGKALRSTVVNLEYFENRKAEIEANNIRLKAEAEKVKDKIIDISLKIVRQASESGVLFGSIRATDICTAMDEKGLAVSKNQIKINNPIKTVGNHVVSISLHPEVSADVLVRVVTAAQEADLDEDHIAEDSE